MDKRDGAEVREDGFGAWAEDTPPSGARIARHDPATITDMSEPATRLVRRTGAGDNDRSRGAWW